MTVSRFLLCILAAGCLEAGTFVWRYSDLVYLSKPTLELVGQSDEALEAVTRAALAREGLTRVKLEAIAEVARIRGDDDLAVRTLTRLADEHPTEARVHLRLGDALRQAGRLVEARASYAEALRLSPSEAP